MSHSILHALQLELTSLYLRWVPWEAGRWRLIRAALPAARERWIEPRYRTIRTRHGFRLRVNLGDWLGRHVFVTGDYEPSTASLIRKLLKPGDTFVDVGANIGFFTLLGAQCVGSQGIVLAFEALPAVRRDLEANLLQNRVNHALVIGAAVSDQSGEASFHAGPSDHFGISSLRSVPEESEVLIVRTTTLDEALPSDRHITLVKLDVEGAEARALAGMAGRLKTDRPDLIVEVTQPFLQRMGDSVASLCEPLFDLGYVMYGIGEDQLRPIERIDSSLSEQFNALFTARKETLDLIRGFSRMNHK